MSSLTPYNSIQFGNKSALASWQAQHASRHVAEVRALSLSGEGGTSLVFEGSGAIVFVGSGGIVWNGITMTLTQAYTPAVPDLTGPINSEWHGRHMIVHQSLQRVGGVAPVYNSASLSAGWRDASSFNDWMQRHTLIHAHIDRQLGIS